MKAKPRTKIPYAARIGQRFGRLKILGIHEQRSDSGNWSFVCVCDCGEITIARCGSILGGDTKSCGCLASEAAARINATHGLSGTPTFKIWKAMIERCCYRKGRSYKNYGGRGITVCDRWRSSFANFYADMGPRPEGKMKNGRALYSIDRIFNDGNYEPGNVRWATPTEQNRNQRPKTSRKTMGVISAQC